MARIRSIKPQFWTSEQVAECSPNARLLFIGLWNFCDDYGIHPASVKRLKMEIFPSDDFCSADIRRMIDELIANRLIEEYEIDETQYWRVTGWDKHQKPDTKTGLYPMPDGQVGGKVRRQTGDDSKPIRRTDAERSPPEKEKEKEKEKDKSKVNTPPVAPLSKKPEPRPAIEFKTFVAKCKESGEKLVSDYRPVFDYAERVKLPLEMIELCWGEFYRRYSPGGPSESKRYKDWRKVFRNCVEGNWFKLWWLNPATDAFELTTAGRTAGRNAA